MRHERVGRERGENRRLGLPVLTEGGLSLEVGPLDLVDVRERHALLGIELRETEVGGKRVVGLGVRAHGHELQTHVDDVAARGVAVGGLDVDAHDHARYRRVHPCNVEVTRVRPGERRHLGVGLVLQDGDGVDELGVREAAGERRGADVAELLDSVAVADVTVAVRERPDQLKRARLLARRRVLPGSDQRGERVLVSRALRGERRVVNEKPGEHESARALDCLAQIHVRSLSQSEERVAGRCPTTL